MMYLLLFLGLSLGTIFGWIMCSLFVGSEILHLREQVKHLMEVIKENNLYGRI